MKPDNEMVLIQRLLILAEQNQAIIRELIEITNPKKVTRKPTRKQELEAMAIDRIEKSMIKRRLKREKGETDSN